VTFNFPRDNQTTDYVNYLPSFPTLNEGTICFWVNTTDYDEPYTSIFSYAVTGQDNEILVGLDQPSSITFYLKGSLVATYDFSFRFPIFDVKQVPLFSLFF